jgi:hypothetical protein
MERVFDILRRMGACVNTGCAQQGQFRRRMMYRIYLGIGDCARIEILFTCQKKEKIDCLEDISRVENLCAGF